MDEKKSQELPPCWQPAWFKSFVRGLLWLLYGGPDVRGIEKTPKEGPLIIASTHRSYTDTVILGAFISRTLYYMAKHDLFESSLNAAFITSLGAFPVNRENARGSTFRTAMKLLRAGQTIVIFPEGGIVNSLGEQGFKEGIGTLATMSGAAILPVYISGSNTLWDWSHALADSTWLAIRVGDPILPEGGRGREARERAAERTLEALRRLERDYLAETGEAEAASSP